MKVTYFVTLYDNYHAALQTRKAIPAFFTSKQVLPVGFALQHTPIQRLMAVTSAHPKKNDHNKIIITYRYKQKIYILVMNVLQKLDILTAY